MQITVYDEQRQANVFDLRTLDAYSGIYRSEHYAFHYKPGSLAEQHIRSVAKPKEPLAEKTERAFKKTPEAVEKEFLDRVDLK